MAKKTRELDAATLEVVKRVLAMPPKQNEELKLGRPPKRRKKRNAKSRDASSKPRNA